MQILLDGFFPNLPHLNIITVVFRLVLACMLGGLIGLERGQKRRPAGFRTYMLVCLGATLAMITNEYATSLYGSGNDITRIANGVITGVGFLGAGTILVTRHQQVKGLTTAAGLWACASMGLAIGIGFYSAAIIGFALIVLAMTVFHRIDNRVYSSSRVLEVYIECAGTRYIKDVIKFLRSEQMQVSSMDILKSKSTDDDYASIIMTIKQMAKGQHIDVIERISEIDGVTFIEEL